MAITWGTQNNWRWCNKCEGLWFGPNAAQSNCPQGGTHSSSGSGNYHLPLVTSEMKVHVKVLTTPDISIGTLFQNMREVYTTCNIDVKWASEEALSLPALNIVDVGSCAGSTTSEQDQLFAHRNFAGANDIVVYFVQATTPLERLRISSGREAWGRRGQDRLAVDLCP